MAETDLHALIETWRKRAEYANNCTANGEWSPTYASGQEKCADELAALLSGRPSPNEPTPLEQQDYAVITRTDGSSDHGGKHDGCNYFVLDVTHDKHADAALRAYADSCESEYPLLAADLRDLAAQPSPLPAGPQGRQEPAPEEQEPRETLVIAQIKSHWFAQGGTMRFGDIDGENADEIVSSILAAVRQGDPRPSLPTAPIATAYTGDGTASTDVDTPLHAVFPEDPQR
ncbi:MAG: hypothetical protein V4597_08285 [Pseudomonadota bacterium]